VRAPRKWVRPPLAADATAGEAFVANARAALEQIDANAAGAAAGRNPEFMHQLRVGVRRLRSTLRAFRQLLRRGQADAIEQPWRALMQVFGAARDLDVLISALEEGELQVRARRAQSKAQERVRTVVNAGGFGKAQRRTFAWTQGRPWRKDAEPGERLAAFAGRALERLYMGLRRMAHDIDWRDAPLRHRVRIRVKRLRYACDFFASAFAPRASKPFMKSLRGLQDILGEMNDIEVQRSLLRELVPRRSAHALVAAESLVRERLAARERELIAALGPAWGAFEARRLFWQRPATARARG
jgi:triphosphatase